MRKFIVSFFILLFGFTLTCGGVLLLNSNFMVEDVFNQNKDDDSKVDEDKDDEVGGDATSEFDITVRVLTRTSSTSYSVANASSTNSNDADKSAWVDVYWRDEGGNASNLTGTRSQYGVEGMTLSTSNSQSINTKYFHYDYWNIFSYRRYLEVNFSTTSYGSSQDYAIMGFTTSDSNDSGRSSTSPRKYIYDTSGSATSYESTAKSNCSTWTKGSYYLHLRKRYYNYYYSQGSLYTTQTIYAGMSHSLNGAASRTGYVFTGWAMGSESGTIYSSYASRDDSTASTNRNWYAKWKPQSYNVMLDFNGGSVPIISQVSVSNISGYSFSLGSDGYYTSGNAGVANSYSLCKVSFYADAGSTLIFSAINEGENYDGYGYDFGIFSNLNTTLSYSNTVDTSGVYRSFYGTGMRLETNVEYNISSAGNYYVYIKYRKDGSGDTGADSLKFKIQDHINYGSGYVSTTYFKLNAGGFYESQNFGVNNSYSIGYIGFNAVAGSTVTFAVINSGETNYDFGIFSNLDTSLLYSSDVDTANVYKSFKGESSTSVKFLDYYIPTTGYHSIYMKYRKDGSNSSGNDSLQWKMLGKRPFYDNTYGALPTPTKANYDFVGWYNMATGAKVTSSTTFSSTSDQTLQARWEPKTYTLTINYNSQYLSNTTNLNISASSCGVSSSSIAYGSVSRVTHTYSTSSYTVSLSRANTSFNYYMRIGSAPSTSAYDGVNSFNYTWTPTGDSTIYIYIYQQYSIGFSGNNYSGGTLPTSQLKIHGTNINIPQNTLTRTSYTANGWNTNSSGTGINYTTVYTDNVSATLYANWTPQYSTVRVQLMIYNGKDSNGNDTYTSTNSVNGGTVSVSYYTSSNNNPLVTSATVTSSALTTLSSSVLINYSVSFTPSVKTGYVYKGISTSSSGPVETSGTPNSVFVPTTQNSTYTIYVFFNKLSKNTLQFSHEEDAPVSFSSSSYSTPTTGYYGFAMNSSGYYESQNFGVANSYSLCKVTFTTSSSTSITFQVRNEGENSFDYGMLSNLNTSLTGSNTPDTSNVYYNFSGTGTASEQNITYSISSAGTYYIYFKYRKDVSVNTGRDSLQFKLYSGPSILVENIYTNNSGFVTNASGYYESQNKNLNNSFSMIILNFNVTQTTTIKFDVISYGESCCDYGIFGKLDTSLTLSYIADAASLVQKSFASTGSSSVQNVVYEDVAPGSHFIYIKYRKDGSVNTYNDSLQFKVSSVTKKVGYFYFEDGEYPQTYVGTTMNNTLTGAITGATTPTYNLMYNTGTGENIKLPVYTYSGQKYAALTSPRTQTLKLSGVSYTFTQGVDYFFKVEPIRWRVSEYGVTETQYPSGWSNYGTYKENFVAVSDKVLGFSAMHNGTVSEGWSWGTQNVNNSDETRSKLFEASLTNSTNVATEYKSINYSTEIDVFGNVGQQDKVTTKNITYTGSLVASTKDINANLTDKRAKASDMVGFYFGINGGDYVDYWTRNLGDNLNNGLVVTKSGTTTSKYLKDISGIRLSLVFAEGSRV